MGLVVREQAEESEENYKDGKQEASLSGTRSRKVGGKLQGWKSGAIPDIGLKTENQNQLQLSST